MMNKTMKATIATGFAAAAILTACEIEDGLEPVDDGTIVDEAPADDDM